MVLGCVDYRGTQEVTPDLERWRALLKARADETGYELALVDVGGTIGEPRIVVCWPTGDEHALSDLVVHAFADLWRATMRDASKGGQLATLVRGLLHEAGQHDCAEHAGGMKPGHSYCATLCPDFRKALREALS